MKAYKIIIVLVLLTLFCASCTIIPAVSGTVTSGLSTGFGSTLVPSESVTVSVDCPSCSGSAVTSSPEISGTLPITTTQTPDDSTTGPEDTKSSGVTPTPTPTPTSKPTPSPTTKPTPTPTPKPTDPPQTQMKQVQTTSVQASGGGAVIDYGNADKGYILVKKGTDIKTRVRVTGPGGQVYQRYMLPGKNTFYPLPLQMGSGSYTVAVFELVSGTKYRKLFQITVNTSCKADAYTLYPNLYSNYSITSKAVKKGAELCKNANTDLAKAKAVYQYIIKNISYDYSLSNNVDAAYVPDPDQVLTDKKAICFGYASLMAAMLRSQGIPVRIVFGYVSGGGFHAWNDIYIETLGWVSAGLPSNGGWKRLDATFGVSMSAEYLENSGNYTAVEYY